MTDTVQGELTASDARCGPPSSSRTALCGWSPPPLPADTPAKRRVDPLLVGTLPGLTMVAVVVALLNIAPHLAIRGELAVDGLAAASGGLWCSLNFWRCRHAHCLVTGSGWLALSIFVFAEALVGHSLIAGYEQPVLLGILGLALLFELSWYVVRRTNAVAGAQPGKSGTDP